VINRLQPGEIQTMIDSKILMSLLYHFIRFEAILQKLRPPEEGSETAKVGTDSGLVELPTNFICSLMPNSNIKI
ncbi:MAG: hypothetical protein KDC80_26555, partial [Saprospiraceae bacterium]|nr:hypothetical protein [Saprospiraceae bacterium]